MKIGSICYSKWGVSTELYLVLSTNNYKAIVRDLNMNGLQYYLYIKTLVVVSTILCK